QYYVQFTLADDHKVTVDGSQLFALDGFSFSDAIIPNIGGASGGAGAGKVTLNPLHLSFEQPGLDPILFQSLAAGTALQQVDIFGIDGDSSQETVDYSFRLALGQKLSIDQTGVTQFDLAYVSQIIHDPTAADPSAPSSSFNWNQLTNLPDSGDEVTTDAA